MSSQVKSSQQSTVDLAKLEPLSSIVYRLSSIVYRLSSSYSHSHTPGAQVGQREGMKKDISFLKQINECVDEDVLDHTCELFFLGLSYCPTVLLAY